MPKSFKPEVHGVGDPAETYSSSAVRLGSRVEAERHLQELGSRWFGFDKSRVVECDDPVNYTADLETGKITPIK